MKYEDKKCTDCVNYYKTSELVELPANCGKQMQDVRMCKLLNKRIWCKYQEVCNNYKSK